MKTSFFVWFVSTLYTRVPANDGLLYIYILFTYIYMLLRHMNI